MHSPRFFPLLLTALLGLVVTVHASAAPAAGSRFGRERYIEYRPGDLPLLLTSSHGGHLLPEEIRDRTWGSRGTDRHTLEITFATADEIAALTGGRRPHVVVSHLRRLKLDPNRPIEEAAQGDPHAEQAWREFHGFITEARAAIVARHKRGLLIDVHGHGHAIARVELGYALGREELNLPDIELDQAEIVDRSTLRPLVRQQPRIPFSLLVRGPDSFGDLLVRAGLPAWPSPAFPHIGDAEFYRGGHIVRIHSRGEDPKALAAIQAELPFPGFRDTEENRERTAAALAASALHFLNNPRAFAFSIPFKAPPPLAFAMAVGEDDLVGCADECAPLVSTSATP